MIRRSYFLSLLSTLFLIIYVTSVVEAQVKDQTQLGEKPSPAVRRAFHYQGCLTKPDGSRYDGTFAVRFDVMDLDANTILFSETINNLLVKNGIFEHAIGGVDTSGNRLNPLIFQKRTGLRLSVNGETLLPVIPIFPAPIAMVALYADSLKQPLPPGPQGPPGPPGVNGKDGKDGINCWDLNGNGVGDIGEDKNADGKYDANDCQGPRGPAGPPGGSAKDTISKLTVDSLIVLQNSDHYGWEHYRDGISVGGNLPTSRSTVLTKDGVNTRQVLITDGMNVNAVIDSTGEIYARSMHVVTGNVLDPQTREAVITMDEFGSEHEKMESFYGGINSKDLLIGAPSSATVNGYIDSTGEAYMRSFHIVTGNPYDPLSRQEVLSFDKTKSVHKVPEYYISGNDTTKIIGGYVGARTSQVSIPGTGFVTGSLQRDGLIIRGSTGSAWIDTTGEGFFRSLHVLNDANQQLVNFNRDGTSDHFRTEIYRDTIKMPLSNGYVLRITPQEGIFIKTPTGAFCSHIDPSGSFLFTGTKQNIVATKSYGTRGMYAIESPEVWYVDRGQGSLVNGEAVVTLDPMFLETVTNDDAHPMIVKITPTDDCNGMFVSVKSTDHFVVRELMRGRSNASFDWEVSIKRKHYEDLRMEEHERVATFEEMVESKNMRIQQEEPQPLPRAIVLEPQEVPNRQLPKQETQPTQKTDERFQQHRGRR